MKSLSNKFVHLTNYSVNKKNTEYKSNSDETACQGHKWYLLLLGHRATFSIPVLSQPGFSIANQKLSVLPVQSAPAWENGQGRRALARVSVSGIWMLSLAVTHPVCCFFGCGCCSLLPKLLSSVLIHPLARLWG